MEHPPSSLVMGKKRWSIQEEAHDGLVSLPQVPQKTQNPWTVQKSGAIHYGERELSFEKTPIINFKMHRPSSMRFRMPRIPCVTPHGDFDYDFESNDDNDDNFTSYCNGGVRESILMGGHDEDDEDKGYEVCEAIIPGDEEIDHKADQFIAKFYEQMKLQRQRSYIQYNEMLNRGTS